MHHQRRIDEPQASKRAKELENFDCVIKASRVGVNGVCRYLLCIFDQPLLWFLLLHPSPKREMEVSR